MSTRPEPVTSALDDRAAVLAPAACMNSVRLAASGWASCCIRYQEPLRHEAPAPLRKDARSTNAATTHEQLLYREGQQIGGSPFPGFAAPSESAVGAESVLCRSSFWAIDLQKSLTGVVPHIDGRALLDSTSGRRISLVDTIVHGEPKHREDGPARDTT